MCRNGKLLVTLALLLTTNTPALAVDWSDYVRASDAACNRKDYAKARSYLMTAARLLPDKRDSLSVTQISNRLDYLDMVTGKRKSSAASQARTNEDLRRAATYSRYMEQAATRESAANANSVISPLEAAHGIFARENALHSADAWNQLGNWAENQNHDATSQFNGFTQQDINDAHNKAQRIKDQWR